MKTKSDNPDAGKSICGIQAARHLIIVAEYGQEDVTKGGIFIPEGRAGGLLPGNQDKEQFWRYRFGEWRFGEVVAIGNGYVGPLYSGPMMEQRKAQGLSESNPTVFHEPPDVRLGDVVMFSRKHGTKVGLRFKHDKYGDLLLRFLDPAKTVAVWDDFEPWWDVENTQVRPSEQFYG
jgi:co-chaperonin GroES (HSP10)